MWRMNSGDRVLSDAEWNLFRVGLGDLWDSIEDDCVEDGGLSQTGVRVFDSLQPEQKLALLADVGQALRDPAVPPPRHTAANEGAIATVLTTIWNRLEEEIALGVTAGEPTEIRSLLLAALRDADEQPDDLPAAEETDREEWDLAFGCFEELILWDRDFTLGDMFLDQPPEASEEMHSLAGVDSEYFTAIPRDPDEAGMIAVRRTLAGLLERPVPDRDVLYPTLEDLYHHLFVGPCTPEEIDAWADHPWMEECGQASPGWDCDYATWVAEFSGVLPATPFALTEDALGSADTGRAWPDDVKAEPHGDAWVIRNDRGYFWCDALANGWANDPNDEMPALTFSSRDAAEAAYIRADKMYGERAARHEAAIVRLDQLEESDARAEE